MAVHDDRENLYAWIDEVPLSRCKKNLTRDFSDGVLMAELCKYYFPKLVDLHNYPAGSSHTAKVNNWETLNRKVLSKLQIRVTTDLMHQIAACVPGALEAVIIAVKERVDSRPCHNRGTSRGGESGDCSTSEPCIPEVGVISEIKKLKEEVLVKNDAIAILNQKVIHLENLVMMKDRRLKELTASVERLEAKSKDSQDSFRTISA